MISQQLKRSAISLAIMAAAVAAGPAHSGEVTLTLAGINSVDGFGSALNETRFVDIDPNAHITGISWNVTLSTVGQSWLSDLGVDLSDGGLAGASLFPGIGDDAPGTASYSGSADLVALGADFFLSSSGRLFFQFFEFFDDAPGVDGRWDRGSLTISFVPEPATYGLAGLALLGLVAGSRRRTS